VKYGSSTLQRDQSDHAQGPEWHFRFFGMIINGGAPGTPSDVANMVYRKEFIFDSVHKQTLVEKDDYIFTALSTGNSRCKKK